jgi:hypothetical protein
MSANEKRREENGRKPNVSLRRPKKGEAAACIGF